MVESSTIDGAAVHRILSTRRFFVADEAELQAGIAGTLEAEGVAFAREHALSPEDRPDFMLPGGLAIEVKVDGSVAEVTRQVWRYVAHAEVAEVLVVTTRARHLSIAGALGGKTVRVLWVAPGAL